MNDYFARTAARAVPGPVLRPRPLPEERFPDVAPVVVGDVTEDEPASAGPPESVAEPTGRRADRAPGPHTGVRRQLEPDLSQTGAAAEVPRSNEAPGAGDPTPAPSTAHTRVAPAPDDQPEVRRVIPAVPPDLPGPDQTVPEVRAVIPAPEPPPDPLARGVDPPEPPTAHGPDEEPEGDSAEAALALADAIMLGQVDAPRPVPPPDQATVDLEPGASTPPTAVVVERMTLEIVDDRSPEPAIPKPRAQPRPVGLLRSGWGSDTGWGW